MCPRIVSTVLDPPARAAIRVDLDVRLPATCEVAWHLRVSVEGLWCLAALAASVWLGIVGSPC